MNAKLQKLLASLCSGLLWADLTITDMLNFNTDNSVIRFPRMASVPLSICCWLVTVEATGFVCNKMNITERMQICAKALTYM